MRLLGRFLGGDPIPPKRLWPASSEYRQSAERNLRFLIDVAGLRPDAKILDLGCGTGRLALPLREYLSEEGRYEGLDVHREAVRWAARNIAPNDNRFRFRHVDIRNRSYNPSGLRSAREFRFPYESQAFDMVVLYSVFTHLVTEEMRHYVGEIQRVLSLGGTCVATFYLMDRPSVVETPQATYQFHRMPDEVFFADRTVPERAVGYPEAFVRAVFTEAGLDVEDPVHYGRWHTPRSAPAWQDTIVARRQR